MAKKKKRKENPSQREERYCLFLLADGAEELEKR